MQTPAVHEDAPWLWPRPAAGAGGTLADAERRLGEAAAAGLLGVAPLAGHYSAGASGAMKIGCEISGVDLRQQPLPPPLAAALRDALLVYKVLVLRDQPIDHAEHVGTACAFGDPTFGHVFLREERHLVSGHPEVFQLTRPGVPQAEAAASLARLTQQTSGGELIAGSTTGRLARRSWWQRRWHTDVTGALNPPFLSILRPGQTSAGGWSAAPEVASIHPSGHNLQCTHWVNLVACYETLPAALKDRIEPLFCHHDSPGNSGDCKTEHPLVAVHPETGEKVLFISPLTLQRVVGMDKDEGEALLAEVTAHAFDQANLDCMMRHELGARDVVMWDNRATMHLAPVGSPSVGSSRQVFRVTCRGQPLLAPDGRASRMVDGAPILSSKEELRLGWSPPSSPTTETLSTVAAAAAGSVPPAVYAWERMAAEVPFSPRDGAEMVALNGRLFVLGGWNQWGDEEHRGTGVGKFASEVCSEVWVSDTNGRSWEQLPDAPWEGRHYFGLVVHDERMWVGECSGHLIAHAISW